MDDTVNQMGLFDLGNQGSSQKTDSIVEELKEVVKPAAVNASQEQAVIKKAKKVATSRKAVMPAKKGSPAPKVVSGLVPEGDVRLTANIRQDLHLRLKIAAAHRRTTIGEIIEELIDKYI